MALLSLIFPSALCKTATPTTLNVGRRGGGSSEEGVVRIRVKVEDRLSSGSGGSAVVDIEDTGLQMVDSGDSYFLDDEYHHGCMDGGGAVDGVQSEDDDGSDNGGTYCRPPTPRSCRALFLWVWS
ncbi:hypothetical protein NE237_006869 [Protea cynaroides]|uniref:Uncharacterized protein n=1 Tax=Protea cynaroides TaxID=273540 RepID=A0A9Q0QVW6_9MAGN|nr:hypothetical protein NE237_006869 [Protea cynaroides]